MSVNTCLPTIRWTNTRISMCSRARWQGAHEIHCGNFLNTATRVKLVWFLPLGNYTVYVYTICIVYFMHLDFIEVLELRCAVKLLSFERNSIKYYVCSTIVGGKRSLDFDAIFRPVRETNWFKKVVTIMYWIENILLFMILYLSMLPLSRFRCFRKWFNLVPYMYKHFVFGSIFHIKCILLNIFLKRKWRY